MSFHQHPKFYGTAAIILAFTVGIVVTLGLKDLYPELEARYQQRRKRNRKLLRRRLSTAIDPDRRGSPRFLPPVIEDYESALSEADSNVIGLPLANHPPPIVAGLEGTIGNTPLLHLRSLSEATGRTILAKAEFLNGAGGSPKDRVALSIIRAAEEAGHLAPHRGDCIYEGTVGSTGISLATLARALGYKAHICMPDDQAREKSDLLLALGATVDRVPLAPITDPKHFVNRARSLAASHASRLGDGSVGFFADQFENPANWTAHFQATGPEIYWQTHGKIDAFVCGAGTGGTMSGVAKYLKEEAGLGKRGFKVVLADPQGSGLYHKIKHGVMFSSTEREGTRRRQQVDSIVEGVGLTRLTQNFEVGMELIDDAVKVTDEQACRMARWLAEHDGIFCGSSTAVNCVGTVIAAMSLPEGSQLVTLLCDSGNRHLSKFWKRIGELGPGESDNLFQTLSITQNL